MKSKEKEYLKIFFGQTLYAFAKEFCSHVQLDNQDETKILEEDIMREVASLMPKWVDTIIQQLEDNGLDSMEHIQKNPKMITDLMTKVEEGITEHAKKLSE